MKNKGYANPLLHALLPVIITIAYILIGFIFDSGWAIGWILFLLIPIIETLAKAIKTKNPSHFAYPVFVAAIFLFTGMMWGWWHPMWVVFVTIPAYYAICDAVKKQNPPQQAEYQQPSANASQEGVYYQPQVNVPPQQPKSNATAIIITAIICAAVVAIIAIVCTFSWLSGGSINVHGIFDDTKITESYVQGPYNIDTTDVESIKIDWVNGNVDVEYYDGDTIYIEESSSSSKNPMSYKVENKMLYIDEFSNHSSTGLSKKLKKDLTVKIPKGFKTDVFSIDVVSADVNVNDLNTLGFELDSVSGNPVISFASQPQSIELDTVSGNITLALPSDITGYSVSRDSISGSVDTKDFGNTNRYGDGYTQIEIESVSGNVTIEKANANNN